MIRPSQQADAGASFWSTMGEGLRAWDKADTALPSHRYAEG